MLDDTHEPECARWQEHPPGSGCFQPADRPCTCGLPACPRVYEGSHLLPGPDDRQGGWLEVGAIPDFIERPGHPEGQPGQRKSFLRLGVGGEDSLTQYEGRPYQEAGQGTVVLHRDQVRRLRDTLTEWLDADEVS